MKKFEDLLGCKIKKIDGMVEGSEFVSILLDNGELVILQHDQSCCENVRLYDVSGDPKDLLNSVITMAQEECNADFIVPEDADSYTWTFYKLATSKGFVDLRWLGESNGYYSESVDVYWKNEKGDLI